MLKRIGILFLAVLLAAWGHGQANIAFVQDGASALWFQGAFGPNSFYVSSTNKIWFCWQGWQTVAGTPKRVTEFTTYDPVTHTWTTNTIAGIRQLVNVDDVHGVPACVRDSDGYVYALYGAHNTDIFIANSTSPDNATSWADTQSLSGAFTFVLPYLVGNKIYVFSSGPGVGIGGQEAVTVNAATFSGGTLTFGARKALFDGASAGQNGWLPINSAVVVGTKIHMAFAYGTAIGSNVSNTYYGIYDTTNGTVCNYSGGTCVTSASQPIGLTLLNSDFKIHTCVSCGWPVVTYDGDGRSHVIFGEGQNPTAQTITEINAIGGGAWSSPHTVYTYTIQLGCADAVTYGPVANASGGIDVYFGDAASEYVFIGSNCYTSAGNILKNSRASDGTWSGVSVVRMVQPARPGYDNPQPTFNGTADARIIFGETSYDYTAINGTLRGFALGDNGYIVRP